MAMVAAACALGLLTGLLVGFSTSGVTASVVSAPLAMAAGVAALTGVKNPFLPTGDSGAPRSNGHNWALCAFALLTVLGLGSGLWARTHDAPSPTPPEIAARWQAIGLSQETAGRLAGLQVTGVNLPPEGGLEGRAASSQIVRAHV